MNQVCVYVSLCVCVCVQCVCVQCVCVQCVCVQCVCVLMCMCMCSSVLVHTSLKRTDKKVHIYT